MFKPHLRISHTTNIKFGSVFLFSSSPAMFGDFCGEINQQLYQHGGTYAHLMNGLPIISTMPIAKNKTGPSTFVKAFSDAIESIDRNEKVSLRIFIACVMVTGLLIRVIGQSIEPDVVMSLWLLLILSMLYVIACYASLCIAGKSEKTSETKIWDRHILIIGASTAYIFLVSASPIYDTDVIKLMTIAVRLEVLLLAIGVPLAYNATIRHSETSIDKDTKKHYEVKHYEVTELSKHSETSIDNDIKNHSEVIELLKYFVMFSMGTMILLLYQLSIFNFSEGDNLGSHTFLGVPIEDILIISISIFLFIYSIFFFAHIIFRLIGIFSMSALKEKRKEGLKQAIRKNGEDSIKENCSNLKEEAVIKVMREMIEEEIDGTDDTLVGGMHHLLNCIDIKKCPEILFKLLYRKVEDAQGENAGKIKSFLEGEFPEIAKCTGMGF